MRSFVWLGLSATLAFGFVAIPALCGLSDAQAQSAADKATARTLATEGIKLFRAGKHAEALDKLERAQKLYNAPPHLLYIARSQVALGKVVEGAETYRTLIRAELPAGSPPAFKQAIDDGKKDLQELEPKVPAVRIQVKPEATSGLEVQIDEERVPAEVVGAERPINPGRHTIKVSAPGFETAEQTVEIKLGDKKPVSFELTPGTGAAPVAGPTPGVPAPAGPGAQPAPGVEPAPAPEPTSEGGKIGFMLGLRLGGVAPFGDVGQGVPMDDFFGAGGGLELHGGVRFARYFTGKLMVGGYAFKAQDKGAPELTGVKSENTATAGTGGIGFQAGTPRGVFGGFGEINLLFYHRFEIKNKLADCTVVRAPKGTALSVGGGVSIPLSASFHLTPFATIQAGQFNEIEIDDPCGLIGLGPIENRTEDIDSDEQKTHGLFVLGIGGEFLFGPDKPVK